MVPSNEYIEPDSLTPMMLDHSDDYEQWSRWVIEQCQDDDDDEVYRLFFMDNLEWNGMDNLEWNGAYPPERRPGGSRPGRRPNIERGRILAHQRLYQDYFCPIPTYTAGQFRRRFRMSRRL